MNCVKHNFCNWLFSEEHTYHTECGSIHSFPQGDGDLEGSDFRFCPYCGKPLNHAPEARNEKE